MNSELEAPNGTTANRYVLNWMSLLSRLDGHRNLVKFLSDVLTTFSPDTALRKSSWHTNLSLESYWAKLSSNPRSWSTNSKQLQEATRQDNTSDPNTTVGILGLCWNTTTDMVSLSTRIFPAINTFVTKRDILQQIFDPLGWVNPVTVRAKILLQEVWQTKLTWDEPLPETIKDRWMAILADLRELSSLLMPRDSTFHPVKQVHVFDNVFVFADASIKAYGAAVYLNSDSHICLSMLKDSYPTKVRANGSCYCHQTDQVFSLLNTSWQAVSESVLLDWQPDRINKSTNCKTFIFNQVKEIMKPFLAPHGHLHPQVITWLIS